MKYDIKKVYTELAKIPAVSGSEAFACDKIIEKVKSFTDFFDRAEKTPLGGLLFYHTGKGKDGLRKKLLFDAHLDTVGFIVTKLLPGGFLEISPVGGMDKRILPAMEIEVYGKRTFTAVFISTPPHLLKGENKVNMDTLILDTGFSDKKLSELCEVGTFCGYKTDIFEMQNGILCGKSMDDKICASAIIYAAELLCSDRNYPDENDIIFSFSSSEEINGIGARLLADIRADAAIILDVNFAKEKDIPERMSYKPRNGCGISYSCITSRRLTEALISCAKKENIPLMTMVESKDTGTNANSLQYAGVGTPCAVLSIPEKYMHTYNEAVSLHDAECAASLLYRFAFCDIPAEEEIIK